MESFHVVTDAICNFVSKSAELRHFLNRIPNKMTAKLVMGLEPKLQPKKL